MNPKTLCLAALLVSIAACGTPGSQEDVNLKACNSASSNGDCNQSGTNTNTSQTTVTGGKPSGPGGGPPMSLPPWVNEPPLAGPYVVIAQIQAFVRIDNSGAGTIVHPLDGVNEFTESGYEAGDGMAETSP